MRSDYNTPDVSFVFRDGLYQLKEIDNSAIPAGFYRFEMDQMTNDVRLAKLEMPVQDRYIETESTDITIQADIRKFFRNEDLYDDLQIAHRRGVLLYGPPGTGKTYSIMRAAKQAIKELNILVFLIHKDVRFDDLVSLRPYFQDRRTAFVFEEISGRAMNRRRRDSSDLLSFLDGELSWEHNYNIATTNYPGDLPGNIVDRPGRFDILIQMDNPDRKQRKKFLDSYLGADNYPDVLVERLDGFSLSYIKEMVLRSKLYDRTLNEILDQFDDQKEKIKSAFKFTNSNLGFGPEDNGKSSS